MAKKIEKRDRAALLIVLYITEAIRLVPAHCMTYNSRGLGFVLCVGAIPVLIIWGIIWLRVFARNFPLWVNLIMIYLTFVSAGILVYGWS